MALRSRIYWDEDRMRDLYSQVGSPSLFGFELESVGAKLRTGVLDVESKARRSAIDPSWAEMLDSVLEALREGHQLHAVRPETLKDYEGSEAEFVYELASATKVHLPVANRLISEGCPPELTVWIADPPTRVSDPKDPWDFFGSYLFLVEDINPIEAPPRSFLSGVSSLARVIRTAQPSVTGRALEDLGRANSAHPIEKLARYGARVSLSRQIEVLYQIRYMTDEQGGWAVSEGRVNDLLGYPLAILPADATQI
jgi:hypothetical protein